MANPDEELTGIDIRAIDTVIQRRQAEFSRKHKQATCNKAFEYKRQGNIGSARGARLSGDLQEIEELQRIVVQTYGEALQRTGKPWTPPLVDRVRAQVSANMKQLGERMLRRWARHDNYGKDRETRLVVETGINDVKSRVSSDIAMLAVEARHARAKAQQVDTSDITATATVPAECADGIQRLKKDHASRARTAFIMMEFGGTQAHKQIADAIRVALEPHNIVGLRADDKQYADDLFANVQVYLQGCDFGIAVYERITNEAFNPNVSLEVGYMVALGKPVCLLKDRTLKTLNSDLVSKLYKEFDPQDPGGTIPQQLSSWLRDKELLPPAAP